MAVLGVSTKKNTYLFEVKETEDELKSILGKKKEMFGIFAEKKHAIQWYTVMGIKPIEAGAIQSCCGNEAPMTKKSKVIAK
jgi:hypothetical protein